MRAKTERRQAIAAQLLERITYWKAVGEKAVEYKQSVTVKKASGHLNRMVSTYLSYEKTGKFKTAKRVRK